MLPSPVVDADFGLSDEQRAVVASVRVFAAEKVAPAAARSEELHEFPRDLFLELGRMGLCGIPFDEAYGGGGLDDLTYLVVLEELARGSLPLAVTLSVHHLCGFGIAAFGSPASRERYLPGLFRGERLGAYALSEATSGSDAASLRTRAERDGEGWRLTGTKRFITHGGEADVYLIMARTGAAGPGGISAFVVDGDADGLSFGALERKMGWEASPMRELIFDGCYVPGEYLVGEEGRGFSVALSALEGGRLGIAACSVGLGAAALDAAVAFASSREQFGAPVASFEGIQFLLADMATRVEAARRLYREAARLRDAGGDASLAASMAKLFASDTAMRVATDAVQVHGGYGYMRDHPVERYFREAKALQIVEGTNQVQRMLIGRRLGSGRPG